MCICCAWWFGLLRPTLKKKKENRFKYTILMFLGVWLQGEGRLRDGSPAATCAGAMGRAAALHASSREQAIVGDLQRLDILPAKA